MYSGLYTIAQINGSDVYTGLVEDFTQYTPEISMIPAVAHAGVKWDTTIRTGLPAAFFRQAQQALTGAASTYKQTQHELFFIDSPIVVDEMVYRASDGTSGDLLYNESQGALQSIWNKVANQTWYGTSTDGSNGFVGVRAQLLPSGSGITAVTASNSTNSTTAFGLWLTPQGVSYGIGKFGQIEIQSFVKQYINVGPSVTGNTPAGYWAYVSNISSFIGLAVVSNQSVFGITGITQAAPLTDKLGAQLLVTVPLPRRKGFTFFMNRLAHSSLQQSRTAINYQPAGAANGTPAWSPPPLELEGYPIVLTDALLNNENNT